MQQQSQTQSTFTPPPTRPMLARVADAMYWMSRYVERSESIARLVLETASYLTDVGDLSPELRRAEWSGVLRVLSLEQLPQAIEVLNHSEESIAAKVSQYMTLDPANPNSLLSCVTRARENARGVRENISGEIWENLNTLYWSLRGDEARARFEDSPQEFYRHVIQSTLLFQGLTDQTLAHGEGWLFTRLGRMLERIDMTCRILAAKFDTLSRNEETLENAERNIHWMSMLRATASLEAYRRIHVGDMDTLNVVAFLVLERKFPRSIRYGVHHGLDALVRIREGVDVRGVSAPERMLGKLNTMLEYAEAPDVMRDGLETYLRQIQETVAQTADALRKAYFVH